MQQKPIYFKTDFKVFVKTEAGFAVPFRFELYTNSPSRPFVARYDGKTYHNCQLLEDGRLLIALDQHGMGLGKLMVKQFYYLNDKDYSDGVCDRVIDPRPVIDLSNKNNPCEIILSLQGDDQIEFTTELPPYYQQGLTPEEHEALINATVHAEEAAASANEEAEKAADQTQKSKDQMAAVDADYTKLKGDLQKAYTDTTAALTKDYTDKKAALDADYAQKKQALDTDYANTKGALSADYEKAKSDIAKEYADKQAALAADYARDLKALNARMAAIESQYATDKAAWQKQTTDFIAQCSQTFTTNEASRQKTASDQRKSEKQTFDQQIAQQDATFQGKEAQRDAAVAEATKVSATVQVHDHAISPYSKHNPLPLTANLARNKMLVMEGDMVVVQDREGWGITRVDSSQFAAIELTMGDTILLPMAHFDQEGKPVDNLMVTGAVLFAAEEVIRDAQGEVIYTRRTSLFRASNDEIATWGGVKKWLAIADGESLLICHPLDITEATVTRNGNDAANAAADLNQRRRIDEKFTRGGYDPDAMVGWAGRLTPTEKTESAAYKDELLPAARLIGYAPDLGSIGAGDSIAERVSPVMREVAGVACGGNQECNFSALNINANASNVSTKKVSGKYRISTSSGSVGGTTAYVTSGISSIVGHKYMVIANALPSKDCKLNAIVNATSTGESALCFVNKVSAEAGKKKVVAGVYTYYKSHYGGQLWLGPTTTEATDVDFELYQLDLTALPQLSDLLPTLGQNDANKVAHRLGFFALQRD